MSSDISECSIPAATDSEAIRSVNEAMIQQLREIMEEEFEDLINTYIECSISHVKNVAEAIDQDDAQALRSCAHSFKGSSSNIGLDKLVFLCKRLELMGRSGEVPDDANEAYQLLVSEHQNVTNKLKGYL